MTCRLMCYGLFFEVCCMDIGQIVTVVGSVGFPIVACCGMAWFIATTFSDFNDLMTKNNVLTEELIGLLRKDADGEDNTNAA
nr:MAG TPA: YvrJ protein family protein [Caudoviricetes sp.]